MSNPNCYKKYIIGRNFVKTTNYETINTGRRKKAAGIEQSSNPMSPQELDTAYQYRQRAKREHLLRLADVNFIPETSIFMTLTFRENVTDYEIAVKAFKGFTKRLRRKFENLLYVATLEKQQRGAYHFHLLINVQDVQVGLDYVVPCWQNGSVDIQPVSEVKSLLLYMTKDFQKQDRSHPLFNKRCYFLSQGLEKWIETTTWNSTTAQIQSVEQMLQKRLPDKSSCVNTKKAGQTEYQDYYFATNCYTAAKAARLKK